MKHFTHILVPYVQSASARTALNSGIILAKIFNAKLSAVYVARENSNLTEAIKADIKAQSEKEKIAIDFYERKGSIHKEITKLETEISADLIIMGSYGVTGFQNLWIGSNAFRVISSSKCPVITMQDSASAAGHFQKVLMPIDDSEETRQKIGFVAELAQAFNSEVIVFAVSKHKSEDIRKKLFNYASQVKNYLDESGIKNSFIESYGNNVADDCIKFAELHKANLIAIMTETEGTNSLFMGTYAQQLVNHSSIPVLSVHSRSTKISQSMS
ncbi:MAG: universal stress protein [Bacteroidia bacterium]|nr:universal stress protein [Bacteroidia bacterium]